MASTTSEGECHVPCEALKISVRPSPETNDHEVCLTTEDGDLIARFGDNSMMGLDPDDLLFEPCPLLPAAEPRTLTVGRCGCGVIGCGSVEVTISRDGDAVNWTSKARPAGARFSVTQYTSEVTRALWDHSWETPDRTAARLLRQLVDRSALAEFGFSYRWASGRVTENALTIALEYRDRVGALYQVLVDVPLRRSTPDIVAEDCAQLLRTNPRTWNRVRWFPQGQGLARPDIAGPGWSQNAC